MKPEASKASRRNRLTTATCVTVCQGIADDKTEIGSTFKTSLQHNNLKTHAMRGMNQWITKLMQNCSQHKTHITHHVALSKYFWIKLAQKFHLLSLLPGYHGYQYLVHLFAIFLYRFVFWISLRLCLAHQECQNHT